MLCHKFNILTLNNKDIQIDANIYELIKLLNEIGLITQHCCENLNNEGFIEIIFDPIITNDIMINFLNKNPYICNNIIITINNNLNKSRYVFDIHPDYYLDVLNYLYKKYKPLSMMAYKIYVYEYYKEQNTIKFIYSKDKIFTFYKEIKISELFEIFKKFNNKSICLKNENDFIVNDNDKIKILSKQETIEYFNK